MKDGTAIQTALIPGVPDKVEKWELRAYDDDGEVYVAASLDDVMLGLDSMTDRNEIHELGRDVVLGNGQGERVHIGEALDRIEAALTTSPLGRGIIDQLWTYYG